MTVLANYLARPRLDDLLLHRLGASVLCAAPHLDEWSHNILCR
jgi:hypothetical protein